MARLDVGDLVLAEARELFDAYRWRDCVALLTEVDGLAPLDGAALVLLGEAA